MKLFKTVIAAILVISSVSVNAAYRMNFTANSQIVISNDEQSAVIVTKNAGAIRFARIDGEHNQIDNFGNEYSSDNFLASNGMAISVKIYKNVDLLDVALFATNQRTKKLEVINSVTYKASEVFDTNN
ncbi:UNVERIFIED_CONTAM: hypothetical protein RF648_19690 [Kocuria sp. CPCC 205274]